MRLIFPRVVVVTLSILLFNIKGFAETVVNDSVAKSAAEALAADTLPTVRDLDELVVERSNVIRRGNTDSYIVTQEMRKGKYTAGELLRNIEGMDYQPMSEEVTYLGSTKVVILLDSIPKDESYIKRQSPDRFDRIDIVQNPGGLYKDYDVLINYHPRPHYTGFESNIKAPVTVMPDGNNGKGKDVSEIAPYLDATYMYDKLTISATASWLWRRTGRSSYSSTEFPLNNYSETMVERDRKDPLQMTRQNQAQGQLMGDYRFSDKHKISILWKINSLDSHIDNNYTLEVNENTQQSKVDVTLNNDTKDGLTNTLGLYYFGKFGQWDLDLSTNYIHSSWKSQYSLNRTDDYSLLYDRKGLINYFYGRANLGRSFMDYKWFVNLTANAFVNNTSESDLYSGNVLTSTRIGLYNFCAFATFAPTPKWSFYGEIGMTLYSGSDAGFKSTRIDPRWQLNIHWSPSKDIYVNAFYLMQTSPPSNSEIQAYGQFVDRFKYQGGDPEVKASSFHMANLGLTFWRRLTVYSRFILNNGKVYNIFTVGNTDPLNPETGYYYALGKYENGKSRSLSIGVSLRQPLSKGFSVRLNGTVNHNYASYGSYNNKLWIPNGTLGLWYENDRYSWMGAILYGLYGSGSVTPQRYSRTYSDRFDLYVRKGFMKNKLSLSLQWSVPVHITNGEFKYLLISPNMIQRSWGNEQFRWNNMLSMVISYRFSTGKQIQKTRLDVQDVSVGSQF
ncbi:MAG: outer membrane beta-barrel family protein [Muribaculaceae bacterium]|nr:outer membrane beta-barrel family protein [Muribaculaceae bacterium]